MSTWTAASCTYGKRSSGSAGSFGSRSQRPGTLANDPLPAIPVDALREHRARQAADWLAAGSGWRASGLVFTTATVTWIEPRNLNRHWYSLRTRAGLLSVRFHDLRHTCVTLLLDAGVPPHIVQAIAGHSGIQVTTSIYAHALQEEQRKALRSLGERLA